MQDGSQSDPTQSPEPETESANVIRPIRRRQRGRGTGIAAASSLGLGRSGKSGARSARDGRTSPAASRRRRIFRGAAILITVLAFVGSGVLGYAFQTTNVPRPEDVQVAQYSTIYYGGGEEMARIGAENRTIVDLERVPEHVRQAVLAAENRTFYSDPGFSPSGIARAAWTNFTEGTTQGGSTITQQYVKKTYLTDEKTISRKFKELIIAIKLERDYSKDEILEFYLNTIYFGRGAYGIEAASEVYFGKPVEQLTVEEAAVLASSIRSPAGYDPQNHPEAAKARWDYVLNGMVQSDWLTEEQRQAAAYPQVLPIGPGPLNQINGPEGVVVTRVKEELATLGFDEEQVNSGGLRVTTTIPKAGQEAAVQAVQDQLEGQPENLVPGLVSVDPTTGAIRAYYGNAQGTGFDFAGRGYRQPGSSFKTFVLAAALENGFSVYTNREGSSPMTFPDRKQPVRNSGGGGCGSCSIKESITRSYNTTFYGLAYDLGPDKVAEAAHRAGVGSKRLDTGEPTLQEQNGQVASAIGIGLYEVTVRDMASSFATFAADGVYRAPYMVQKVTDAQGNVLYEHQTTDDRRFSHEVANDVSFGLRDVAAYSNDPLAKGRPSASKTGTVQLGDTGAKDAWMVGYTPQLSTAVWIGTESSEAIINAQGRTIFGAGVPGKIWQQYMNTALADAEIMKMPSSALIKGTAKNSGRGSSSTTTKKKPAPTSAAPKTTEAPPPTTEAPPTTEEPPPTTEAPPPSPEPAPEPAPEPPPPAPEPSVAPQPPAPAPPQPPTQAPAAPPQPTG